MSEKCCMCNSIAEYFVEVGSPAYKEYLCRSCAIINEQIARSKPKK